MHKKIDIIKFNKFVDVKYMIIDIIVPCSFAILFIFSSSYEKNLFLSNNGLGLLEHINIWLFLAINIIVPIGIYGAFKILRRNIDKTTFNTVEKNFEAIAGSNSMKVLFRLIILAGFCCFIGNSLQNAKIINQLDFDYWDSINYMMSYIISRTYKFYLFVYFLPTVLFYVFVLIKAISNLSIINKKTIKKYPLQNFYQLNAICSFGLNILTIILISFTMLSCGVFSVHDRLDITTITTIAIAVASTAIFFFMYLLLVKKYYIDISNYKKKQQIYIDMQLSIVHKYILQCKLEKNNNFENYIRKEEYLWKVKKQIEELDSCPLVIRAIYTGFSPFIPIFFKNLIVVFEYFF